MKSQHFFLILLLPLAALAADTPPVAVDTLVATILAQNPERRFYEQAIAAAKSETRLAGRLGDPELSFDLGHKRVHDASSQLAGEGLAWSVSVTQPFPWPGRLALRQAIASHDLKLAQLGLARFDLALSARARRLAYGLRAAHAKAAALREVADRFADLKATFLARDPAGLTPLLETRVIAAAELTLQRRAANAELAVQSALLELNQLRGAALDEPLRVAAPELAFQPAPPASDLLSAALENNFDYAMRRVQLAQQTDAVTLARQERNPGFSLGPYFSQEKAGDRETIIGLSVSLPLPLPGRTSATVAGAQSRRAQAETALAVARRELERDLLTAAQAYAVKCAELARQDPDALTQYRDAAMLADRHYRLGAVNVATYVELQISYLDAVEALLDTRAEALAAALELHELTGLDLHLVTPAP